MFSISVLVANQSLRMLYQKEENAQRDFNLIQAAMKRDKTTQFSAHDTIDLVDDFGQKLQVRADSLHGQMFEDLERTKLANIEYALHGARTQAGAQRAAESDPALRATRAVQGPSIISPMGNGRLS